MDSGVKVSEHCVAEFNKLKIRHSYKYIIFRIENSEEVVVDILETDNSLKSYDDIIYHVRDNLRTTECRYIIADMPVPTPDGVIRNRIYFIFWSPESAKSREKMLYASSKDSLVRKINGIFKNLEITCGIEEFADELKSIILNA